MGVFDSILCSTIGKSCSYEHNAKAAADSANKGKPQQEQVVPVTSIDEAKQMAMKCNDVVNNEHMTVFGAAKLKDPKSISTRNEYCGNLAEREGVKGDAILAGNVDDQSLVCIKFMNK